MRHAIEMHVKMKAYQNCNRLHSTTAASTVQLYRRRKPSLQFLINGDLECKDTYMLARNSSSNSPAALHTAR